MACTRHLSIAVISFIACTLAPLSSWAAVESQESIDALKAGAAQGAAHFRESQAYKQGGCDVDALLGSVIARSREPLLQAGDRIVSVNGHVVQATDSVFHLVNALPPSGKVRLGVVRNLAHLSVNVQCLNSTDSLSLIVAAYEAAAAGNFAECADRANEYASRYVQQSLIYGLWRRCSIAAGRTVDEQIYTTYLTYWTLTLQELKYHPELVDGARPDYLGAQTQLLNHGQALLVDELRRQWTLATGEPNYAPPSSPATVKYVAPVPQIPQLPIRARSVGSSCERGHWIEEVMDNGAVVELEDGSTWQVDAVDTVDSALWLPTTNIVVCDGKLINTEDNESLEAERIR